MRIVRDLSEAVSYATKMLNLFTVVNVVFSVFFILVGIFLIVYSVDVSSNISNYSTSDPGLFDDMILSFGGLVSRVSLFGGIFLSLFGFWFMVFSSILREVFLSIIVSSDYLTVKMEENVNA